MQQILSFANTFTTHLLRSATLVIITGFLSTGIVHAETIKKSRSAICHDAQSPYYEKTKNFEPYPSLQACLASGGRLPRGYQGHPQSNADEHLPSGYDRDLFPHWQRQDGCVNTRHALLRDLSTTPVTMSNDGCYVIHGRWNDPYTGIVFTNPRELDVDHLVPLKAAYDMGAGSWSLEKRTAFANDPVNLFAVKASVNRSKSASGLLEWLPPNKAFACQYATRYVRVMIKYEFDRRLIDEHKLAQKRICDK